MRTKRCGVCREVKPIDEFHANAGRPDGRQWACKPCACARQRPRNAATNRRRYERDPDWSRNARLLARYDLTPEQFGEMVEAQDGRCAICGGQPAKLVVDHDHETGRIRGLLCTPCNTRLHALENVEWRDAAETYLAVAR